MKAIFAGKTKDGANAVLYLGVDVFYVKVDDGNPQALTSPSFTTTTERIDDSIRLKIESPEWNGEIVATRFDLVIEEGFAL